MSRRRALGQRGVISVELALATPILVMLILGGVHLGRALGTRHRVADATGFAARAAAVSGDTTTANVRAIVNARLGGATAQCAPLTVTSTVVGAPPARRLEVTSTCTLTAPFGASLLADIGAFPDRVTVSSAFPF